MHQRADALFRRAVRERTALLTTNLIVAEVYRFLLFHAGKRPADAFLERLDASPLLTLEFLGRQHHQRAREWLARLDDQIISYTDATSFAVMELTPCDAVLSFDHDFVVAGFRVWG